MEIVILINIKFCEQSFQSLIKSKKLPQLLSFKFPLALSKGC